MKRSFLATVILFSSMAHGTTRNIYDLMYLPKANTNFGMTELNSHSGRIKFAHYKRTEIYGNSIAQTLGRSFTDQFSASANLYYADVSYYNNGNSRTKVVGVSDPVFNLKFRAMEGDYLLDILGGALYSRGSQHTRMNGDQNNLTGGPQLFAGLQLGKNLERLQWSLLAQVKRQFRTTDRNESSDDKTKYDERDSHLFQGDLLGIINEKSFIRTFLSLTFREAYYDNSTPPSRTSPNTRYIAGAEYQHLCKENLLMRLGVNYDKINTNAGVVNDYHYWTFRLAANYQF
ncbi:MAG: hypothetical protein AB7I27_05945 [Bacteriovoracaceae bacterium]